jgi:hypothetical protein
MTNWIHRTLTTAMLAKHQQPVTILTGPRQSGKTTLIRHLLAEKPEGYRLLSLDDLQTRSLANADPALLLGEITQPILIDEAQYAPNIFPEIKRRVDEARFNRSVLPPIWLTGSHQISINAQVRESLAGRASYLELHPLSTEELANARLFNQEIFLKGSWPFLYQQPDFDPATFLNDYIRSFLEKDVALLSGVQKLAAFDKCVRLLAARTGQILNLSSIAGDVGVQVTTVSDWISLLEQNRLVSRISAFSTNLSKRAIKSPKFHFLDVGLATRIQGWRSLDPLIVSPAIGALFESLVCSELIKARDHSRIPLELFHFRSKEHDEIDFIVKLETDQGIRFIAIEAKFAAQSAKGYTLPTSFRLEDNSPVSTWVVIFEGEQRQLQHGTMQIPVYKVAKELAAFV